MTAKEISKALPLAIAIHSSSFESAATQIDNLETLSDNILAIINNKVKTIFRINESLSLLGEVDAINTAKELAQKSVSDSSAVLMKQIISVMSHYEDVLGTIDGNTVNILGDSSDYIQSVASDNLKLEIVNMGNMATSIALLPKYFYAAFESVNNVSKSKVNNIGIHERTMKLIATQISVLRDVRVNLISISESFQNADTIINKTLAAGMTLAMFSLLDGPEREAIIN